MTKIAVISDIHGNQTAFEAVIDDIKSENVSETWFLGDLFLPGPAGNDLIPLLEEINTTVLLRGNWDDVLLKIVDHPDQYNSDDPSDVYMGLLSKYLSEKLNDQYISIIRGAPIQTNKTIHHLNFTLSHNEKANNGGPKLVPTSPTDNFEPLFENESVDVAIYAHTHHQLFRYTQNDQLILNPGSIGEPFFKHASLNKDRRAQYTILDIDDTGIKDIHFKKVAYDIKAEILKSEQEALPYIDLYDRLLNQGISPTQDKELLQSVNEANEFKEMFQDILNALK
ncbi:metallophosphoesterase family protein [Weissella ceti]|uniref:metallophosphoesterase family protein n=1 Tax=Weissella ceti TaxID=759620 RepID=UPI001BCBFC8C|nr:metallophosphoesterase family protein [Weissella ceti]QVK11695.1 metallophosphoesterase family protein [Weissella ceti]